MSRGFGIAAGLDPEIATPLAARCAQLGYASMWSNDTPVGDGLETLAAFAAGSDAIELGVGALALDRHTPEEIGARIDELGLPRERLVVGVGAGHSKRPVSEMRAALPRLREALGDVRIVLAAMGPRMCELAGAGYDGAFLNWLTPELAAESRERVLAGAAAEGREAPPIYGYVRAAVGEDAERRLAKEEAFYRDLHEGYRRHFARIDAPAGTVGVAAADAASAQAAIAEHRALDVVVIRALASATLEAMTALAEALAPAREAT